MRVHHWYGKAVALALLSVAVGSCGNPFGTDSNLIDARVIGAFPEDPQLRAFYEARKWQAAWTGRSEKALLDALEEATIHGLRRDLFLKEPLPEERDQRDAALTSTALRYAAALAHGYADPTRLGRTYTVPHAKPNVAAALARALEAGNLAAWFNSLAPQTEEYRALSQAFVHYLRLTSRARAAPVPPGRAIKPGQRDRRVSAVFTALAANGYIAAPEAEVGQPAPLERYSPTLVVAVKRLQDDYGLKPDGVIGSATLAALNRSPADLARQIAVNLERRRWLRRDPPGTRIHVNTAAALLDYWRGGQHRDRRRVVVGQPDWETPELESPMLQLVAHPFWRVPDSILEDELQHKGPGFFAEQGMEWRNGRLVQLPGPKNALGEVKFDLRNDQHIYLHDTPAKAIFALPERHRSHGCVRVYDALGFALLLASDDGILTKFQEALMEDDEMYVKLKAEVPVRLMYHTAFVDNGRVRLVDDVYGWDDDVARALGYVRPARVHRQHERGIDVGP